MWKTDATVATTIAWGLLSHRRVVVSAMKELVKATGY
jgi:hypothetical protein